MNCGVYAKPDYEIAASEIYCLVFYKNLGIFGTKLYQRKKLIAVCEHDCEKKATLYAFINDKNESIFNDDGLCAVLGEDMIVPDDKGLLKKDEINVIPADAKMPTVSEKGIAYCLKHWKLGNQLNVFEDAIHFTMNTSKIEYVMMIRKPNDDIYCGASITIPYDNGLFGGHQYFRIRNYSDNAQPWCRFHCHLGAPAELPDFPLPDCSTGSCITTSEGLLFEVKRHDDDEIVLQGCGDDEYFYYRDAHMTERFKL